MIRFLRSFMATIAERVMRLSPIPAASFPSVVPEQGQITTASIGADPDADFAPMLACSSRSAPVLSASSSGVVSHSCLSVMRPELLTTSRIGTLSSCSASASRTP